MWPFDIFRDDEVDEMRECDHPEWEDETEEILHPKYIYSQDGELFINRYTVTHKTCTECGVSNLDDQKEERVYLSVDRVEGVDND
jgi:translation initiation factor 2 beta subunit (eIF-2beta)/eIF-5